MTSPSDLPTLRALEARLVAATGPDRSIDIAMWEALEPHKYLYAQSGRAWAVNRRGTALNPVWEMCADPRMPVTASIDAAVAMVERVLPGWDWTLHHTNGGLTIYAQVGPREQSYAFTPALALLIALVKAKIRERGE